MIWRVLVVHKRSNLEAYTRKWGRQTPQQRAAVERVFSAAHVAHEKTVELTHDVLVKLGATVDVRLRDELKAFKESRYALVVTVGGDGTLLSVAPQLRKTPVLAVNSSPKTSVGFFAAANVKTLKRDLAKITNGDIGPWAVHRMQVRKNGVVIGHPALNDALFAHPSPVMTTRHFIKPPNARTGEEQKSSGIWVSTPAGSSSAARAAGGVLLDVEGKEIQYVVREPYVTVNERYRYTQGVVPEGETLTVESRLPRGSVFIDGSAHEETVGFGDVVTFSMSPHPLWLFGRSAVLNAIHI
jgi:NAD+ kinase